MKSFFGQKNSQMCTLNSKCNTKVASGLAAQNCQFDNPSHNLAWYSFPDEPNSKQVHPFSAPHKNLQDSSQRYLIDQENVKLVVDSRCVELCIRVLPAKYLMWMGNHPLLYQYY